MKTTIIDGHESGSFEFRGNVIIYVKDNEIGGYTGWFRDIPAVVAEGETLDELSEALDEAYEVMLASEKKINKFMDTENNNLDITELPDNGHESVSIEFRRKVIIIVKVKDGYKGWYKEREDIISYAEKFDELVELLKDFVYDELKYKE